MSGPHKKVDKEVFLERLHAGKYLTEGGARKSIGHIVGLGQVTKKDSKELYAAAEKYFGGSATKSKKKRKETVRTVKMGAPTPYEVLFSRHCKDPQVLQFLRGAADAGRTLPDLVTAMELMQ